VQEEKLVMQEPLYSLNRREVLAGATGLTLMPLAGCGSTQGLPSLALDGRVIMRADADYDAWRTGLVWQSRKPDRGPAIIVRPNTAKAVADAIRYARANKLKVAVKSSGHHVWANFLRDEGMLIDMWHFRKVEIDADGETAWIEPSVWSRDIMLALGKQGRAFPAAHCASVGMGGFLLGGGVGLNWENWGGLSANSIIAAEVVTADSKLRQIDDTNDPELAWALRGAGNGFPAVVTRFKVKTYPAPNLLKESSFFFPITETPAAMAWIERLARAGKLPNCEPLVILAHNPMAPAGAPPEQTKVCVVRINCFAGSASEAAAILAPLGKQDMASKAVVKMELQDWTFEESFYSTLDFRNPLNYGHFGVDSLWTNRAAEALPVLAREFVKAPTPASHVVMSLISNPANPANAAARVHGNLYMGLYSVGSTKDEGDRAIAWLRATAAALAPYAAGRYINEIDAESDAEKIDSCFAPADRARIAAVRKQYDPQGLFHDFFGRVANS
jgi:FAD/FMN-containing dehydrogenase